LKKVIKNLQGLVLALKKDNYKFLIDKTKLNEKLNNFPLWMENNIDQEIKYFENKKNNIDQTILNLKKQNLLQSSELIRVQIKNNKVKYQNFLTIKFHPRFIRFHNFLKRCLKVIKLPNIDFLYSIHDSFDDEKWLDLLKAPIFCISKLKGNSNVVLFPHVEWMQKNDELLKNLCKAALHQPWDKKTNQAFWRGTTTGFDDLEKNERFKVVKLTKKHPDIVDAYFSHISSQMEKTKDILSQDYLINERFYPFNQIKYKYLLAIDGHAFAGSFFWQLFSSSLILKNKSNFLEWYYAGLKTNRHFIEYENPHELVDTINFLHLNDSLAKSIAKNALDFANDNLSNEMIIGYIKKLLESFVSYTS